MIPLLCLIATLVVYLLALRLQKRCPHPLMNPVLITIVLLISALLWLDISYAQYNQGAKWLTWLMEPAVVALGLPLYQQMKSIRRDLPALLLIISGSALLALVSTVVMLRLLGGDLLLVASLAPRSVTTPVAIAVAEPLGGAGALAALGVLITGLLGAMFGLPLLKLARIVNPKAQGVAMGVASHALGTATMMKEGEQQGAYSALSLVLCAIITALLAPMVVPWLLAVTGS